jgi:hypothetical protein
MSNKSKAWVIMVKTCLVVNLERTDAYDIDFVAEKTEIFRR